MQAIDAAGGSGTQVGQFLQSLFSQAAGVEQGNLFQTLETLMTFQHFQRSIPVLLDSNGFVLGLLHKERSTRWERDSLPLCTFTFRCPVIHGVSSKCALHFPELHLQAVQRVRDANGGILPSLDGSFVEQVMKLINNGLGGGR
eukprot:1143029-Pelagomonas_calceolata.AAC.2